MFLRSTVIFLIFFIIPESDATTCYVQNSYLNVLTQACPTTVTECMQFDCRVTSPKKFAQITKGCNDPNNGLVSCSTIMSTCESLGGTGQCYICSGDYCNSSKIPMFILSLLIPFSFPFFITY